jgi:hypothetical protein
LQPARLRCKNLLRWKAALKHMKNKKICPTLLETVQSRRPGRAVRPIAIAIVVCTLLAGCVHHTVTQTAPEHQMLPAAPTLPAMSQ